MWTVPVTDHPDVDVKSSAIVVIPDKEEPPATTLDSTPPPTTENPSSLQKIPWVYQWGGERYSLFHKFFDCYWDLHVFFTIMFFASFCVLFFWAQVLDVHVLLFTSIIVYSPNFFLMIYNFEFKMRRWGLRVTDCFWPSLYVSYFPILVYSAIGTAVRCKGFAADVGANSENVSSSSWINSPFEDADFNCDVNLDLNWLLVITWVFYCAGGLVEPNFSCQNENLTDNIRFGFKGFEDELNELLYKKPTVTIHGKSFHTKTEWREVASEDGGTKNVQIDEVVVTNEVTEQFELVEDVRTFGPPLNLQNLKNSLSTRSLYAHVHISGVAADQETRDALNSATSRMMNRMLALDHQAESSYTIDDQTKYFCVRPAAAGAYMDEGVEQEEEVIVEDVTGHDEKKDDERKDNGSSPMASFTLITGHYFLFLIYLGFMENRTGGKYIKQFSIKEFEDKPQKVEIKCARG